MLPGGAAPGLGGSSREGPSEGCVRPRSLPPPSLSLLLHSLTFQNSASPTAIPWMSANSETSLPQAVGRQALFQAPSQAAAWDTREGDLAAPLDEAAVLHSGVQRVIRAVSRQLPASASCSRGEARPRPWSAASGRGSAVSRRCLDCTGTRCRFG